MPSPEQVNWAKFRASAVILAALMILGTLVYLLTGGTFLEPKAQIYLYLPDATGVAPGSPVRVDGISVGKVSLVELSGSNEPNRVVKGHHDHRARPVDQHYLRFHGARQLPILSSVTSSSM